ncbi:MAG TPA: hypothetical protein VJ782_09260 [Aeromicrobium sp.]|nr:hypothetical protein [Aeromicrobium sp.]
MIRADSDDLQRISRALKEAGDKGLQKRVSAAMRQEAKPLGERVLRAGAGKMPRRGGLSSRISSRGKVLISNSLGGKSASVTLRLKTSDGYDLRGLDRGQLRHPVYGHRKTWVRQSVPANAFTEAFEAEAPRFRQSILKAAQDTLNDVARKA